MSKKFILSFLFLILSLQVKAADMIVDENFVSLFNHFRYSQPTVVPWAGSYFAYGDNGIGVGIVNGYGYADRGELSASHIYDLMYNNGQNKAHGFEVSSHSCENVDASLKQGCRDWWGHCNGWSAAAIKEAEPRKAITLRNQSLEVGHQKALLTELWLSANDSFIGETQKQRVTGSWIYDVNDPDYKKFWDVTPRQAILTFLNQVGAMKTGVVVDRFTGDQVWNQPIVGYRILPIRKEDTGQQSLNGHDVYFAKVRMKIYWANDNVYPGHLSTGFSIDRTGDSENDDPLGSDYSQRLLKFKLFFDAPVVTDATGTQIQSAGQLVGDGLWDAQENPVNNPNWINQSHPDFIWQPQSAYIDFSRGYGNPGIGIKEIAEVAAAGRGEAVNAVNVDATPTTTTSTTTTAATVSTTTQPTVHTPTVISADLEVEVDRSNIYDGDDTIVAERLILRIFRRANMNANVDASEISFSGDHIIFRMHTGDPVDADALQKAFEAAEAKIVRITPL